MANLYFASRGSHCRSMTGLDAFTLFLFIFNFDYLMRIELFPTLLRASQLVMNVLIVVSLKMEGKRVPQSGQ